jgi:hypothetical protein
MPTTDMIKNSGPIILTPIIIIIVGYKYSKDHGKGIVHCIL